MQPHNEAGDIFTEIGLRLFQAECDADGHRSFTAVERSMSDRLLTSPLALKTMRVKRPRRTIDEDPLHLLNQCPMNDVPRSKLWEFGEEESNHIRPESF